MEVDNFLLRELRADLLPGRSYWTSEAATSSSVTATSSSSSGADLYSFGQQKPKQPQTAGKAGAGTGVVGPTSAAAGSSLKKLGLRWERGLVVELLPDVQSKVRPPAGAFRVWVQQLLNPGAPEV